MFRNDRKQHEEVTRKIVSPTDLTQTFRIYPCRTHVELVCKSSWHKPGPRLYSINFRIHTANAFYNATNVAEHVAARSRISTRTIARAFLAATRAKSARSITPPESRQCLPDAAGIYESVDPGPAASAAPGVGLS